MSANDVNERLGAFYDTHRQELFTYALSITGSFVCAEDAVHEAFSRVLRKGRLPETLRPYLFRCVRNAALDTLRHAERERRKMDGYSAIFQKDCAPHGHEAVSEWLSCLSDREREWVVLKVYGGLTFREIAEVCAARQGTVAAGYWRGLQKLRGMLGLPAKTENKP
jgi:RNA polymerase sigma-70 factor (ECF subfamily)